ncbi:MAG: 3-dehydroquinate synthase, partial [Actinomycetota bacterium]
MNEIKVSAERDYVVSFPNSWRSRFSELIANRSFAVIVPEQISSQIKDFVDPSRLILTSDGESQKSIGTYGSILEKLALMGLDRSSLIVGIGGGATTDLAGFVAATYLRGVDWVAIPTTVAGMVDAAIGGKTGLNLTSGKNLAGAFFSPHEVVIDTNWLSTLSDRDIRAGLA